MHASIISPLLLVSTIFLFKIAQAAYVLSDDYSGEAFFKSFDFFTGADPTNGHVSYVSMAEANATGLAGFLDGGNATKAIYMGVDVTNQTPEGRGSVRVSSNKTYQHALVIADIVHMPGGVCGTWPAFWMLGDDWPNNGEIDIVEGVNDQPSNQMTLHTSPGPRINKASDEIFTGDVLTQDCDVNAPGQSQNAGCAIGDVSNLTFGPEFNVNGGGVYATEWTSEFIKIWFFPRGSFPNDIASASPSPSTNWGAPTSLFTGPFNMDDHFRNLRLIFDITFCGDWAGNTWSQSSCASLAPTCEDYVAKNPAAFTEAYWAVNTLQVFQDDGRNTTADPAAVIATVGEGGVIQTQAPAPGVVHNNGRFVKNRVLQHLATTDGHVGELTGAQTQTRAHGKWVQPQGGWNPRTGGGGAVLPKRDYVSRQSQAGTNLSISPIHIRDDARRLG